MCARRPRGTEGLRGRRLRRLQGRRANHLVSLRTLGNGSCGASYTEWQDLQDIPTIDLCEIHDYYGVGALSRDAGNGIGFRIKQCAALGKPIIIGGVGLRGMALADRAAGFADKIALGVTSASTASSLGPGIRTAQASPTSTSVPATRCERPASET
jgi:hypothetical protein